MSRARDVANLIHTEEKPNRNIIINGAMNVNQRGTVSSVTSGTPYGGPDRFTIGITNAGTYSMSQSSTVPSGTGLANSYKLDCTTADASLAADHEVTIQYKFEGQDLQTIMKGTSDAKPITVSFWCRSNLTGTFTLEIFDNDNSRQCSKNYTISSADTFEYKTITFPADTTGAFADDNNQSATLVWWLAAGSNATSGTQNTSAFAANTTANRVSSSIVNMSSNTANEFLLTGVQMEVGNTATAFEHEPYDVTLAKCYRYYYKQTGSSNSGPCHNWTSSQAHGYVRLPKPMRANPTGGNSSGTGNITFYTDAARSSDMSSNTSWNVSNNHFPFIQVAGLSQTAGQGGWYALASSVYLELDAEL